MPDSGLTDNVSFYTSTFHDTYVRQQVVTTCTAATRPSAVEGRVIYETDTDLLLGYNGSAWVPFSGPFTGSTSYTTQIDQGASTNIAKTTNYSKWSYVGPKKIHWTFELSLTAGGTAGSNVTLTLPLTAASTSALRGVGLILDASTQNNYPCTLVGASTTTLAFQYTTTGTNAAWGTSPNLAAASTDALSGSITYEIA